VTAETEGAALVRGLYDAFRAGDHDALRRLLAPDVVWAQSPGFPGGTVRHGAEAVIRGVAGAFAKEWEGWRFRPDRFLDAGSHVVVLGAYVGVHRQTGRALEAETAHVFELADGRITGFRQYSDTHTIRAAAQP
jgi:hypothetical protein